MHCATFHLDPFRKLETQSVRMRFSPAAANANSFCTPLDSLTRFKTLVTVFPCVSFPSRWQRFLSVCQPGGGPGSAQLPRAGRAGPRPQDSRNLVSDTTLKLPAGLSP